MVKRRTNTAILQIGGSEPDVEFMQVMCARSGWEPSFTVIHDGRAAIGRITERAAGIPRPHLILLDLDGLGQQGHELLTLIRSQPEMDGIPIVMLTDIPDSTERQRSLSLGAAFHVLKPTGVEEASRLMQQLEACLPT